MLVILVSPFRNEFFVICADMLTTAISGALVWDIHARWGLVVLNSSNVDVIERFYMINMYIGCSIKN